MDMPYSATHSVTLRCGWSKPRRTTAVSLGPHPSMAAVRPLRMTEYLRKQDRGQPLAALERGLVGRTPGIEKLHQLFAGAVVIPFAVALDDGHELFERVEPPALAVERQREVKPCLMIGRIGRDFLFQFGKRTHRFRLLRERQRRLRRGDRR